RTRVLDAAGRLVLPGFVDAHNHVRLGSDDACA
ncbi:amidohydrolase family protein, partial [Streptomyces hydrogenans]